MKTIEDTTEEDFDATFRLNVKGPYFLVQVPGTYGSPVRDKTDQVCRKRHRTWDQALTSYFCPPRCAMLPR